MLSLYLELLGDEWLKLPAMHYRWNYNFDFVVDEFGRNNDPGHRPAEQRRIGEKIAQRFHDWLPPLGVTPRTIPVIEAEYLALLSELDRHFAEHPFLLGLHPSLGDFAFFGPLYAHLYRDPASGDLMRAHAPRVVAWIERLRDGPAPVSIGDPHMPPSSLLPVLWRLSRDFVPFLVEEIAAFQDWLAAHAAEQGELPRHFGQGEVVLGRGTPLETKETRALFSYDQWMVQRVLDAIAAAGSAERPAIEAMLGGFGARALADIEMPLRVERRRFRLVRAAPAGG